MVVNLLIVLFLLLMNGFFAMAELAIVSLRRARLKPFEKTHPKGAALALAMSEDTSSFLSVVQVGITLDSVFAGAFSGVTLSEPLAKIFADIPFLAAYSESLAMAVTVMGVSYLSLVVGELVPKRVGLAYAEAIAVRVTPIMSFLAWSTAPVVWLLKISTELLLKLLRVNDAYSKAVTEEDIKDMIAEGTKKGVFHPAEKDMLDGVFRLADRSVRTIMTPRIDVAWVDADASPEDQADFILKNGYSRLPVARGDMEEVLGTVHAKDLLNATIEGREVNLQSLMREPFFVPDTTSVLRLIDQFKKSGNHLAVVIDEYGSVEGLVSVTDVIEGITGDLPEPGQERDDEPVLREDGSWLLDGMMPIDEVETLLNLAHMQDGELYHTVAGFMIDQMEQIPKAGDFIEWECFRFEVVDMDGRRIDKVLVTPPQIS